MVCRNRRTPSGSSILSHLISQHCHGAPRVGLAQRGNEAGVRLRQLVAVVALRHGTTFHQGFQSLRTQMVISTQLCPACSHIVCSLAPGPADFLSPS